MLSNETLLYLLIFQDPAATPTKATKKEKKQLKKKSDKDDDRASPEANAQEQMAAQRASGGVIDAPPEIRVGHTLSNMTMLSCEYNLVQYFALPTYFPIIFCVEFIISSSYIFANFICIFVSKCNL